MANRTYRYYEGKPLFAFGHGLSYSTFQYANSTATVSSRPKEEKSLEVSVEISNSGKLAGDEVVQVYLVPPHAREKLALGAFARVHLAEGEKQQLKIPVPAKALRRWNTAQHEYAIPSGDWKILIGASSADIRQTVSVKL